MKIPWIVAAIVSVLVVFAAPAPGGEASEQSFRGIARAQQDMRLKFAIPGRVAEVLVLEGQRVSKGEVLIRLDDQDAREQLKVLRLRADSTIEIDSAQASLDLATSEEQRVRDAHKNGGANEFEVRRAELVTLQAKLTLGLRQRQQLEAVGALRRAELALREYSCISSIDGVVEEIGIEVGELVDRHAPVVRVVRADPLRIEVSVATAFTLSLRANDPVKIRAVLSDSEHIFTGHIVRFAQIADPASGTRMVIIEAPKPEQLPAGIRVLVEFNHEMD